MRVREGSQQSVEPPVPLKRLQFFSGGEGHPVPQILPETAWAWLWLPSLGLKNLEGLWGGRLPPTHQKITKCQKKCYCIKT